MPLLARRQCKHVSLATVNVNRLSYEAPSHFVYVLLAGCEIADVGATIVQTVSKRLRFSDGYVCII